MVFIVLIPALILGCGSGEPAPIPQQPAAPADSAPAPQPETASGDGMVKARLKVVGLDGAPILGMAPIATRQPNAFDEPAAIGPLSNAGGLTEFEFPGDEKLYIRAWDPEQRYFANNYYDAMPNTGNVSGELVIQMAPSAKVSAVFNDASGAPLANTEIAIMLYHPNLGPWWPVDATTDTSGRAVLGPVPPGQFNIRIKCATGLKLELPATPLPPGQTADLGTLTLQ